VVIRLEAVHRKLRKTAQNLTKMFVLWLWLGPPQTVCCDMSCTSGFVDNVMFSHSGPMARHVYSYVAIKHDEHNSRDFNQILLNDKDQNIHCELCSWGKICYLRFCCSLGD